AAQLGMRVGVVERRPTLGGTCLNVGCIPSKALLDSSELYYLARERFGHHGIRTREVGLDLAQMLRRKDDVVKTLTGGIAGLFKKNNITFVRGQGRLLGGGKVSVQGPSGRPLDLEPPAIILATGSEPAALRALPFDEDRVVSSTEALCFKTVPE